LSGARKNLILLRRVVAGRIGEGQWVLLSGEAGIGKSRLTVALLEQLAREPHCACGTSARRSNTDSALYSGDRRDDGRRRPPFVQK